MRSFLFSLFFGVDEVASRTFALLDLRKKSLKIHSKNKILKAELKEAEDKLSSHILDYHENRHALENAYNLVLD